MFRPIPKLRANPLAKTAPSKPKKSTVLHIVDKVKLNEPTSHPRFKTEGVPTLCDSWCQLSDIATPNERLYSKGVCKVCKEIFNRKD